MDTPSKKSVTKLQPEDEAEKPVDAAPVEVPPGKRQRVDEAEKQKKDASDSSSDSGSVLIKHGIEGGPSSSSALSSEHPAFWSENIGSVGSLLFKHRTEDGPSASSILSILGSEKKFRFKKGVDPIGLVDKLRDGEIPWSMKLDQALEECPTSDDSDDDGSSGDSDDDRAYEDVSPVN